MLCYAPTREIKSHGVPFFDKMDRPKTIIKKTIKSKKRLVVLIRYIMELKTGLYIINAVVRR